MNLDLTNLENITFLFDSNNWNCSISVRGGVELVLERKGTTNKGGQWYQLDDNLYHWISFNPDKFNNGKIEAFYKRPINLKKVNKNGPFKYYRKQFKDLEKGDSLIIFNYSPADEWIKDLTDGKWRSKYNQKETNNSNQPWKTPFTYKK